MRFRIDSPAIPPRRFRLPVDERATAPALPELYTHVRPHTWGAGTPGETHKRPVGAQTPKRTSRRPVEAQMGAGGLYTARAPIGPRKGRTVLDFVAADETPMQSFMGTLALRINPDAVDLSRLESGLLSLAIDHDAGKLMGRVFEATIGSGQLAMLAEVSDTPTATNTMAEIADLTRQGFSPGFIIHATEVIDPDHPDYDEKEMFQIEVTRWEPFEISSTSIPRNPNARLRGVASMNSNAMMDAPEILHREDMVGLSLAAGRQVLRSGSGSEGQREKLEKFFSAYETGLENGLSRDKAAQAAKLVAGL